MDRLCLSREAGSWIAAALTGLAMTKDYSLPTGSNAPPGTALATGEQ